MTASHHSKVKTSMTMTGELSRKRTMTGKLSKKRTMTGKLSKKRNRERNRR